MAKRCEIESKLLLITNRKSHSRRGSAMVPSDRAVATFYKLLIVTMSLSAAVSRSFHWKVSSYKWSYLGNGER